MTFVISCSANSAFLLFFFNVPHLMQQSRVDRCADFVNEYLRACACVRFAVPSTFVPPAHGVDLRSYIRPDPNEAFANSLDYWAVYRYFARPNSGPLTCRPSVTPIVPSADFIGASLEHTPAGDQFNGLNDVRDCHLYWCSGDVEFYERFNV